jgi:hypothetical protein
MDPLEVVKAVAPYVTAVVAVLAAAFTAWLSHRNWVKQFNIQRSEALLKEQIRLMREVPKALNDAIGMAVETLYALACSDAFARVNESAAANYFIDGYGANQAKLHELLRELEVSEIAARIYFDEAASSQISEFRNLLLKSSVSSAHIEATCIAILEARKSTGTQSEDMHALIARLVPVLIPRIAPAFVPAKDLRLAIVRTMASRINAC